MKETGRREFLQALKSVMQFHSFFFLHFSSWWCWRASSYLIVAGTRETWISFYVNACAFLFHVSWRNLFILLKYHNRMSHTGSKWIAIWSWSVWWASNFRWREWKVKLVNVFPTSNVGYEIVVAIEIFELERGLIASFTNGVELKLIAQRLLHKVEFKVKLSHPSFKCEKLCYNFFSSERSSLIVCCLHGKTKK